MYVYVYLNTALPASEYGYVFYLGHLKAWDLI